MWTLTKKRDKVDAGGLIQDFGVCFGAVIPVIVLGEMLADRETKTVPTGPVAGMGLQGTVKDVAFTVAQPATPQFTGAPK